MTDTTPLSTRELEILELLAQGKSNKEIAADLVISVNTVKVHISNIFQKTNTSSRSEAIVYAVENGLVESLRQETPEPQVITEFIESEEPKWLFWLRKFWWLFAIALVLLILGIAFILSRSPMLSSPTPTPHPYQGFLSENRWQSYENLSSPRANMAVASYKNELFAIGGETLEGISSLNQSFDIRNNRWSLRAPKPTAVKNALALQVAGKLYIFGGEGQNGKPTDLLEIYDPETDSWSTGAKGPKALSRYSATSIDGKIFFFGGWDGKAFSKDTYIYSPSEDKWTDGISSPIAFADAHAVSVNNCFLIIGGTINNEPVTTVRIYAPSNGTEPHIAWSEPLDFFEAKEVIGAQMIGDSVIAFSKVDEENIRISYYSSQGETWGHSTEKNTHLFADNPSVVNISGAVFFIGGRTSDGELSNQFTKYQAVFTIMIPAVTN